MKMAGATNSTVRLLKNDQPGVGAGVENVVHNSILVQVVPNIYRKEVKIVPVPYRTVFCVCSGCREMRIL
jgi:hypothetical protein